MPTRYALLQTNTPKIDVGVCLQAFAVGDDLTQRFAGKTRAGTREYAYELRKSGYEPASPKKDEGKLSIALGSKTDAEGAYRPTGTTWRS